MSQKLKEKSSTTRLDLWGSSATREHSHFTSFQHLCRAINQPEKFFANDQSIHSHLPSMSANGVLSANQAKLYRPVHFYSILSGLAQWREDNLISLLTQYLMATNKIFGADPNALKLLRLQERLRASGWSFEYSRLIFSFKAQKWQGRNIGKAR